MLSAMSIGQWLVLLVVLIGVVAIVYVVSRQTGVAIPAWVAQIFWIVVAVVAAVFAIRLLLSLV